MHEYGIVQTLLQNVEREASAHGALSVHRIKVRVGELSGVDHELLALAFETFRSAGICAAAEIEITKVDARWICPGCECAIDRGAVLRCPQCHRPAKLAAGAEIILDQIEMEVSDV